MQVPDNANLGGQTQNTGGDFQVMPDKTKVSYSIHKAEIRTRSLDGSPRKSLNLGLICSDINTGAKNYVWSELYIDGEVWLTKDKNGQPWMVNQFLAFTGSCGIRERDSRVLPDAWFNNPTVFVGLTGEAVLSKTDFNGKFKNEIKYFNLPPKGTQSTLGMNPSAATVEPFNGASATTDFPNDTEIDDGIPF